MLGQLRLDLAERFDLIPEGRDDLLWIVDWPLLERNEEGALGPAAPSLHRARRRVRPGRPGRGPGARLRPRLERPGDGRRLDPHQRLRACRSKVFAALGIDAEEAEARFGFLLEALRYGAPPHGGIAYGLDRIVQRLAGADSIRDVIAFPKTASGADALTGAPAPVDEPQLREVGLSCVPSAHPGASELPRSAFAAPVGRGARSRPDAGPRRRPAFDTWEVVRDFGDVRTARAWHQALEEAGIEAALTADWPIDRFGRGDICPTGAGGGLERGRAPALQPGLTKPPLHDPDRPGPQAAPVVRLDRGSSPYESRPTV